MNIVKNAFLILFLSCLFSGSGLAASDINQTYGALLTKYVKNGVVDYIGLKREEAVLDSYLAELDSANPELLNKNDKLAFYINAYNAYTIKLIVDNFRGGGPVKSIKDIGGLFSSPWSIKFCKIGGRVYTLDNIEHDIIRPTFKDPRVHFAVNCASKSCPPLISVPYKGAIIDRQLDENTVKFINDSRMNYLKGNNLYVSKIFKWFGKDFQNDIKGFFLQYAREGLLDMLKSPKKIRVKYLDYDWSLNDEK